jgi:hypothetical protein
MSGATPLTSMGTPLTVLALRRWRSQRAGHSGASLGLRVTPELAVGNTGARFVSPSPDNTKGQLPAAPDAFDLEGCGIPESFLRDWPPCRRLPASSLRPPEMRMASVPTRATTATSAAGTARMDRHR